VPKSNEKLDLATRAAWLYYVAGNTQNEIAEKLQVSRPVAQRLVAFAVEKNLIRVRVDHQLADCLSLAEELSKRYGLTMCEVVPVDSDTPEEIDRKLAVAGAQVMERYLNEEKPMVVAVGSGRTLKAAVDQIAQLERPQHRLVSMVGAIAQDAPRTATTSRCTFRRRPVASIFCCPRLCSPIARPSVRSGAITACTGSSNR
jgi:DNA-binding transcriptional regulator LsrR (DeoR family)